ncbi:VHS domain protein [Mucor ambiguus]|uniref:VHS domain protein n=1 Tax=Mucor ambiguus TaxID=91626 RepID=A0A0C9MT97_9FUNG|nr:VHS domain protein [Mucor ambiguus]
MGFFTEDIQKTSVSLYIERLSNLEEVDWYLLQQLTESIQMQEHGPREAVETVRKKLKHGGTQQKLRVLEILKLLMENSNQQFHRQFLANEKMKERFELMLTSPGENPAVKKELVSLLGAWAVKYKNEPGMKAIQDLFEMGRGGGRRVVTRPRANTDTMDRHPHVQSPTTPTSRHMDTPTSPRRHSPSPTREEKRRSLPPAMPSRPAQPVERSPPPPKTKSKPRSQSSAATTSRPSPTSGSGGPTRVFNFEKAKPKILEEIALGNSNANNLVNALKLINTSEDRWEIDLQHDKRLQGFHDKCEESKKRIVRYARLVEDEDWIGTLLATNEGLLKALEMYDIMLAGEIPAAWSLAQQNQQQLRLAYQQSEVASPKQIRAPPPPPPPQTLQIEDSFHNMQLTRREQEPEEELDPFADPVTPIEDENRR